MKSTAAAAVFSASLLWAVKAARKNGPFGAAVKGLIALAVMKKAKNALISGQNGGRRIVVA